MSSRISIGTRPIAGCTILLGMLALCASLPAQRIPARGFPVPVPNQPQKPAVLKMHVEGDWVTADITDCPMQKALQELADRTGIIFEVRSQDDPLISVHLYRVSLQEAIERIASGCNTMFFYGRGQPEPDRITLVRVFPRTNPVQQPSIIYLGSGVATKSNEDIETPEQALKALEGGGRIEYQLKAIEVLVNAKSDAAIDALIHCVDDPAPNIRIAAIQGLALLDAHRALPAILKRLKDAHPGVRQSAATAVGLLGDAKNLKNLKPLTSDRDAGVAQAAELAMRKLSATEKR
jgi:hypothetical protein